MFAYFRRIPILTLRNALMGLIASATLLAACSSTTLSGSWKDPEYRSQVRKIYIVGVARQDISRRMFEDAFSRELQSFGVTGLASYKDLPNTESLDKEDVTAQLRRNGADSILMARATNMRIEQVTNPGYVAGRSTWDGYYARRYDGIYMPPTTTEFRIATIEANLYEAGTGKLIWSAQLETVIENNLEKLFADFARTVTDDMKKEGML